MFRPERVQSYLNKDEVKERLVDALRRRRGISVKPSWFNPYSSRHELYRWYTALCNGKLHPGLAEVLRKHGCDLVTQTALPRTGVPATSRVIGSKPKWTFIIPRGDHEVPKVFHGDDLMAAAYGCAKSLGLRPYNGFDALVLLRHYGAKLPTAPTM